MYATILADTKNDLVQAEKYYLKSLEINPEDEQTNRMYACFLIYKKKDEIQSLKYLQKVESIVLNNFINNINEIKKPL